MIFCFQMIPHLQSIKVIPKFLLENSCTTSLSSKTSGYSFLRDKSHRGNCRDNAPQERFFGQMKDEIDLSDCETFDQVKALIDDRIDYYNNDRYP